jgi:4-hydroxyphenylpyruvate dioxygenase
MKTSIATVSLSGDLSEKLEAISAAGFDGIEIFEQDFIAYDRTPREVGAMVRDHGLEITLFQPFRDFEGLPESCRTRAFARAERKFDVMQELGTDLILVCSSVHREAIGGIDRAAADFHELGQRAARRGLRVAYEALAWGRYVNDHRDAWEIVRRADHPNVGLVLDSFHTLARRIPPDTIRRIPDDKIFFVQLADAPAIEMDLLYWSRHFRNMPGEGDLDMVGFLRAVMATGYRGPLSLEIFNDQYRSASSRPVARDGYLSLVQLVDQVRCAEPAVCEDLPAIPSRSTVEAIEFIEFASGSPDVGELETLLTSAGFAKAGRHVKKDVTVWRQGEINVLVNTEATGFAHASSVTHGAAVSEIALRVTEASQAAERARALGTVPFEQEAGAGELQIPGVRGVGGSVLRFVDSGSDLGRLWDIDFAVHEARPVPGVGLLHVDHVAQTMAYGEMPGWALFYTSIFEATRTPMVDVADPDGLVRSQAIEVRGDALRITLNGADSQRTLAGRFIADSFGSSVQHIAFATADIFATALALAERGFPALEIGANYYDDLEARFGLTREFSARLRAANILYDRDSQGEFFQLYSRGWANGMFFEIVERRNGYKGYGAANAPFRTAALRRAMRPAALEGAFGRVR